MTSLLVCINDGLLKIRINRILSEKNYVFNVTEKPIKRDDLIKHDFVIIHTSYRLNNLYNFIRNAILSEKTTIIFITSNKASASLGEVKNHDNLVIVDENKMDVELPLAIELSKKYSEKINRLVKENTKLLKQVEENKIFNKCKRELIKKGFSEDEAHKYILQFAMNNHIDKIEACNRLLTDNSE